MRLLARKFGFYTAIAYAFTNDTGDRFL